MPGIYLDTSAVGRVLLVEPEAAASLQRASRLPPTDVRSLDAIQPTEPERFVSLSRPIRGDVRDVPGGVLLDDREIGHADHKAAAKKKRAAAEKRKAAAKKRAVR